MAHLTIISGAPPGSEITSLLLHLAGEFAPAIASRWPAPHAPFVTAPAPRRQLIALALSTGAPARDLDRLLAGPLKAAIRAALADPPAGLTRALGRMGEVCWSAAECGQLLWALRHPQASKAVRHAPRVTADLVRMLAALPPPMILAATREDIGPAGAELLGECYRAIARRRGEAFAEQAAAHWARLPLPRLRQAVLAAFVAEPPPPPFSGTARLRPLATLQDIRAAGRRYRNCLREDLSHLATGDHAYYEWLGEPGAVVELYRDQVIGWRFEQARLARNAPVPAALGRRIEAELASMGVALDRPYWQLRQAVYMIGTPQLALPTLDALAGERFGRD
jgi:hypothetical protein